MVTGWAEPPQLLASMDPVSCQSVYLSVSVQMSFSIFYQWLGSAGVRRITKFNPCQRLTWFRSGFYTQTRSFTVSSRIPICCKCRLWPGHWVLLSTQIRLYLSWVSSEFLQFSLTWICQKFYNMYSVLDHLQKGLKNQFVSNHHLWIVTKLCVTLIQTHTHPLTVKQINLHTHLCPYSLFYDLTMGKHSPLFAAPPPLLLLQQLSAAISEKKPGQDEPKSLKLLYMM